MIRRVLAVVVVIVTALLLQSTVFAQLRLLGVRPELLYLVTIVFAFLEGPTEGAVVGFVSGLAQDLMLNEPKGILALTLTLLGYTIGMLRQLHRVAVAAPADDLRRDSAPRRRRVLRDRLVPARQLRRDDGLRAAGRAAGGAVQRGPDADRVPAPAAGLRRLTTAPGGALLGEEMEPT